VAGLWRQRARKRAARQPEAVAVAMARAMHEATEALGPIREAAVGLRTRLEGDGFSPSAAEYLAVKFMTQCLKHLQLTVAVDIGSGRDDDPWVEPGRR
jgi:hypothetical protein